MTRNNWAGQLGALFSSLAGSGRSIEMPLLPEESGPRIQAPRGRSSKHQVHVRKRRPGQRPKMYREARATVHPAGSKLAKYFAKARDRGPRGY
jgi:hypothetical protein